MNSASPRPPVLDAVEVVDESDGSVYVFVASAGKTADELITEWQASEGRTTVTRRDAPSDEGFSVDDVRRATAADLPGE